MELSTTGIHFCAVVQTPFGAVGIRTGQGLVHELVYLPASTQEQSPTNALAAQAAHQVERYCLDPDFVFELPLAGAGTAFQKRVWEAISAIPRGQVITYGQLARQVQSAPRAVGQACGANWFPLIIPCHRVTSTGGLGGFSNHADGFHLDIKRWLLAHEGAAI